MGKKRQKRKDLIGVTPYRLGRISAHYSRKWFNFQDFIEIVKKKRKISSRILRELHRSGWLVRRGKRRLYEYRLSKKALKYRREYRKFTNPEGWLYKRWL